MKFLAVIAVVGIAFLAVGDAANCDKQRFQTCTDSFAKELGLPGMPQNLKDLLNALKALAQKGLAGLQQICRALQNAKNCFGDQYDSCISVDYLTSIGEPKEIAIAIVVLVNDVSYACTTSAQVFARNAACIIDVGQKNLAYFLKCATDYQENLDKDPCKYSQIFIDCVTYPFKNGCPAEVAQTMCEMLKPGYVQGIPGCSITCSSAPGESTTTQSSSTQSSSTQGSSSTKQTSGAAQKTKSVFSGLISFVLLVLYRQVAC